jgi:hypothetical protein
LKTHAHYVGEGIPKDVFVDILESKAEAAMTFVGLESCQRATLRVRAMEVTEIERFVLNGHVFGYLVKGTLIGFDAQGRKIHFGSEERAYYYDPKGSGKFSVMRYGAGELKS